MNLIHNLKNLLIQTKYTVHDLDKIKNHKPYLYQLVDLILETNTHYICFKDVWTWNNLTLKTLNNYLYSSVQQNLNMHKKFVFILLVKNNHIQFDNQILNQKNIYIIEKKNQKKLIKEISYFLYLNDIYFYEQDGSSIMLE